MRRILEALLSLAMLVCGCASAEPRPAAPAPCLAAAPAGADDAPVPAAEKSAGSSAIPYDLPRAGEFVAPPPEHLPGARVYETMVPTLTVDIDQSGRITVNGQTLQNDGDLVRIARETVARDPDTRAILRADRAASWGTVVLAIDQLKQGGIAKLAFAVSPLPP